MTVKHTLASLDDEQARDLLLQVARGQEECVTGSRGCWSRCWTRLWARRPTRRAAQRT